MVHKTRIDRSFQWVWTVLNNRILTIMVSLSLSFIRNNSPWSSETILSTEWREKPGRMLVSVLAQQVIFTLWWHWAVRTVQSTVRPQSIIRISDCRSSSSSSSSSSWSSTNEWTSFLWPDSQSPGPPPPPLSYEPFNLQSWASQLSTSKWWPDVPPDTDR